MDGAPAMATFMWFGCTLGFGPETIVKASFPNPGGRIITQDAAKKRS
jgi:hypothetical protein